MRKIPSCPSLIRGLWPRGELGTQAETEKIPGMALTAGARMKMIRTRRSKKPGSRQDT